jgi:hypothetical protein
LTSQQAPAFSLAFAGIRGVASFVERNPGMLIPDNFFLEGLFAASSVFFDPLVFCAG